MQKHCSSKTGNQYILLTLIQECHCFKEVFYMYLIIILNITGIHPTACTLHIVNAVCKHSETYPYCRTSSVKTNQTNAVQQATGNLLACLCMHASFPNQRRMYNCLRRKTVVDQSLMKNNQFQPPK